MCATLCLMWFFAPCVASAQGLAAREGIADVGSIDLSMQRALELASDQDPALKSVMIERDRADLLVDLEENRFVPTLSAEGGYRAGQTAQPSPIGTQFISTRALSSNVALQYTLPYGTQLGAALRFERAVQDSVIFGNFGTTYGTNLSLDVAQPWLRGFGEQIGRSGLRDALYAYDIAELEERARANALAAEVLRTYWTLWFLSSQQEVVAATLALQLDSLEVARARFELGVAAKSDVLRLESDVAQAREEILSLEAQVTGQQVELSRLTGQIEAHQAWRVLEDAPVSDAIPTEEALLAEVVKSSPDALRLVQLVTRAELQSMLATDQARPDLQTVATLSINGVGQTLDDSLSQIGRFEAVVGYVGVRVSLPLVRKGLEAQADRAELAIDRAKSDLEQARQQLQSQALTSLKQWEVASARIALAEEARRAAQETAEIEQARFEAGDATALEVTQALTRLSQSSQRIVSAQRDAELARIEVLRITGTLIDRVMGDE